MDRLMEEKQMEELPPIEQARNAMFHVLDLAATGNLVLGYYISVGSQSFSLLTEALATIWGQPLRQVRERFICRKMEAPIRPSELKGFVEQVRRAKEHIENGNRADAIEWLDIAIDEAETLLKERMPDEREQEKADDYDTDPERLRELHEDEADAEDPTLEEGSES